ncbi:hypothetical protein OG21DRAFT_1577108 [Imleria badia]|nr:hypothetical protein OG21DRAFT_1577108 [Imleria badia]
MDNKRKGNQTAMRLRSLGSQHVFVKDTAFQTWYTLLNYLYTGKISFLPLSSPGGNHNSSTSSLDGLRCSAKSMYRLTCKVGLRSLRDLAFSYIRSNLTEHNILKEISCSLVLKHPQLLEMELDVLYSHIASPSVVANFTALAQCVAHKELPHGADIMVGIHTRLVKEHLSFWLKPGAPTSPESLKADSSTSNVSKAEPKDKTGPHQVNQWGTQLGSLSSGSGVGEPTPSVPPQASADIAVPTAILTNELGAGGKRKVAIVNLPNGRYATG